MTMYPYNTNAEATAQTDAQDGIVTNRLQAVLYEAGSPAAPDDDYIVASANMKVGAYTLAHTTLAVARNVTLTHTQVGGVSDTLGTVVVVGTNIAGDAITETLTPTDGGVTQGAKAFKTITSVTGDGWVINTGNDTIKVGFGDKLGLPDLFTVNTVFAAYLNDVKEGTAPTLAMSATALESNTIDLNSASNGNPVKVLYFV